MRPIIWYIHGASSTPRAFNWLRTELPNHTRVDIAYSDNEIGDIIARLEEQLDTTAGKISIVGHSLGGVIGVALSQKSKKVSKVFTISAPFGGSEVATYLRWVSLDPLLSHVHPRSPLVRSVLTTPLQAPVMSVVTTSSRFPLSIISPKNDGVVTYASQMSLSGPIYRELHLNHFEVLLAKETADYMNEFLF